MFDSELKFVVKQNYTSDYTVNMHAHPCYEIVFYIEGNGTTTINNITYEFKPNTFTIIEPNCLHSESGDASVKLIYIGFNILNDSVSLRSGLYDNKYFDILEDMLHIQKEMKTQNQYYGRMLNLTTEEIIIKIKRGINEIAKEEEDKILYIQNFIKLNCMKNIKVKLLADTFGFNYDYFRRMFKEKTGISLKDYIMQEKINYTLDLLKNSDFSMKEISSMAGFASPSHFGIVFKKMLNKTPKEYLDEYKKANPHAEIANFNGNKPIVMGEK